MGRNLYSQLISPNDSRLKVEGNLTGSGQIFTVVRASHEIEPNRLNFSPRNQCGAIHRLCFRGQNMLPLGGNVLWQGDRNVKTLCALDFLETERGRSQGLFLARWFGLVELRGEQTPV